MGSKGLLAAGVLPAVAGLGALIGGLVTSQKKKKQEGSGVWRVAAHQPFLLNLTRGDGATWQREIHQANNDQLRALVDVIRNLPVIVQGQISFKKAYKTDSTFEWTQNSTV